MEQCCQKDISAQAKVYQMYSKKLFALCLKYAKNYADAEDVLQDSFILIFNKIDQYKGKGSFEGWLKRITINVALQKYRQKTKLEVVRDAEIPDETYVDIQEKLDADFLLALIQQLPNQYRLVFNLYVLDHFSHKEIAEMLDISEGTSKSNLSRARSILKDKIIEYQKKQQGA
ncbi:RNA polymerase sigma factor [Flavobacteriaceae bacterium S356]|uniref:RNA polymerase sigma factor n=1 Tax=Asprobacillus argus TaxID=3076534 RepID=A0ABU3LC64_9FLAO|nr:RNA polymerase sigma factor [Flavobacteriaceae bacterium S356]